MLVIKGLLGLCELGALLLLARLLDARALILYAWNPVIVLELWGQAHTEAIAVLGMVGCVWAVRRSVPCRLKSIKAPWSSTGSSFSRSSRIRESGAV